MPPRLTGAPSASRDPLKVGAKDLDKELLAAENAALARKNAALMEEVALAHENASLAQENARLVEQNAMLRLGNAVGGPPGMAPPMPVMPVMPMAPPMGGFVPPPGMPNAGVPPYGMPGFPPQGPWGGYPTPQSSHGSYHGGKNKFKPHVSKHDSIQSQSSVARSSVSSRPSQLGAGRMRIDSRSSKGSSMTAMSTSSSVGPTNSEAKKDLGPPTTVMMKNIPDDLTREQLLEIVDAAGFKLAYDVVSLPIDLKTEVGLGYAFLNFVQHEEADKFKNHFQGFKSWPMDCNKECDVLWSENLQGFDAHVERYRNSPVMHETVADKFKPALFKEGARVPFPEPTKTIRAPRARRRDRGGGSESKEGAGTSSSFDKSIEDAIAE